MLESFIEVQRNSASADYQQSWNFERLKSFMVSKIVARTAELNVPANKF